MKVYITYRELESLSLQLAAQIARSNIHYDAIYGIPRGGVPIAALLSHALKLPLVISHEEEGYKNILVVDDLIDSGETLKRYPYNDKAVLFRKTTSPASVTNYCVTETDGWIVFPYEQTEKDTADILTRVSELVRDDPDFKAQLQQLLAES